MLYNNYYVESLSAVLKRYAAPVTFKIKSDALIGETYSEIKSAAAIDGEFKEIKNKIVSMVELHLIPVYATDIKMILTNIDLEHEYDKTITLSTDSPYLITLAYDVDKGVKVECDSDDAAVVVRSIIEFLNIDVSGDGYISEKSFLEFDNVEITVYESDNKVNVVNLTNGSKYYDSNVKSGGVINGKC